MKLTLHQFTQKLKHPFTIARSSKTEQDILIVELEHQGIKGFGEATANTYYQTTLKGMVGILDGITPIVESLTFSTPEAFWNDLYPYLNKFRFILAALDMAAHDLFGKMHQKPLYELWGLNWHDNLPQSSYTISLDEIDTMVARVSATPWPIYKVKLGKKKQDYKIVKAIREVTDATLRLDVNCAWTIDQTLLYADKMESFNIEFLEQPMRVDSGVRFSKRANKYSPIPIIADERAQIIEDLDWCKDKFWGINIKLSKCGGLTPALKMIQEARRLNLKVMAGCMTESSIGISALSQLLPLLDYADMDGALFLEEDIASGTRIVNGKIIPSDQPGIGAILH